MYYFSHGANLSKHRVHYCWWLHSWQQYQNHTKLLSTYNGAVSFLLLKHTKNKGLSASRNTGTEKATGDYIYYLDSDDELMPNCIEHLVDIAKTDDSIEIVQGNTKDFLKMLILIGMISVNIIFQQNLLITKVFDIGSMT